MASTHPTDSSVTTTLNQIESFDQFSRVTTDFEDAFNQELLADFERLKTAESTRKSHYFGGRFENIYIDRAESAAINQVLSLAEQLATKITGQSPLQTGFWFNEMPPGHFTTAHSHDDDDELLSAVYYVSVPQNSGRLILGEGENREFIQPVSGQMIFFSPALVHEVEINQSDQTRVSIAMNFGS